MLSQHLKKVLYYIVDGDSHHPLYDSLGKSSNSFNLFPMSQFFFYQYSQNVENQWHVHRRRFTVMCLETQDSERVKCVKKCAQESRSRSKSWGC